MLTTYTAVNLRGAGVGQLDSSILLLNTELMNKWKTVNTNNTQMTYNIRSFDRRTKPWLLEVDEAIATVRTDVDLAYANPSAKNYISLSFYPDNNRSKTAVAEEVQYKDIAFGIDIDTSDCWIWIQNGGFELKKYIVNSQIATIETAAKATV